jgi:hypothetical protein
MSQQLNTHIRAQSRNNFLINLVLNAVIAWFLLKDKGALTPWGETGYGADLVITGFLLAALVALFAMKIHRGQLAKGLHQPLANAEVGAVARLAGSSDWGNSLLFGLAGALLAAATVGVLMLLPLPPFDPLAYAVFKGVWAGVLAALVVPPAIRLGLRTAS